MNEPFNASKRQDFPQVPYDAATIMRAMGRLVQNPTSGLCAIFSLAAGADDLASFRAIPNYLRQLGGETNSAYFWPADSFEKRMTMLAFMYTWSLENGND